jgi:hypothetical protein
MSNPSSSIVDKLDADYAPAWRPNPGESLIGEVVEIGERIGEYAPYPIVTVNPEDGEALAFHAFHSVAAAQLAEKRVKIGDHIGILYKGKVEGQGPHGSYHSYRVIVDRGDVDQAFDWGRYGDGGVPADVAEDEALAQAQLDTQDENDKRDSDVPF